MSNHNKKILYISYDGMTDPLGQSQVLPYLIGLSKLGYQFTLLSAEKKENFALRKEKITQLTKENNIDWQPVAYTKKPPILSTLYDVNNLYRKAKRLHSDKKFDFVHCRSYIASLVGLRLKRKLALPFVFDMRGFWADERVDGGLWNLKNPLFRRVYNFFKQKEKNFLQNASQVISLTHHAEKEIITWKLPQQAPITVIPCCVDLQHFSALMPSQNEPRREANRPFTLSYLGSLGTWYMLDEMLAFFVALRTQKPDAKFLFITPDAPQIILDQALKYNIPANCFIIKRAERQEVPTMLLESDLSIFFVKPAYSKKASSPTKMGEILAMGIPIIANTNVGDNEYLFQKYECGLLLENFEHATLQNALADLPLLLSKPPQHFRAAAVSYFGLQEGVSKYAKVYQNM